MEERNPIQEACDGVAARVREYYAQHPDEWEKHCLRKRRMWLKNALINLVKFLWLIIIIVFPLVIDVAYPKMIPWLCWLNLSVVCDGDGPPG
jgi:hypothetical protein